MTGLKLGDDFTLPLDAITETFAILAVKRAGKSNAAVVFAEELYDNNLPWVAIDPKGDWWGVRSSADGKKPGMSVVVFGGEHHDVPLEVGAGHYIADLIVEKRLTCVLDVSEFNKADQRRFLQPFAERLYRRNREPLMVFCEEADEYIPQRVTGDITKVVSAFETLVKRGGFRGVGVCLITQRSASLNKDVLTQAGNLFAMQTPSPQDQDAIKAWIRHHSTATDIIARLSTLQPGEAWFFSPAWLRTLQEIRFRRRRTFDSGATPKIGQKVRPPSRLADVDLGEIKEAMSEAIERAKAEDPKELRKQIAELKAQLAEGTGETRVVEKIVEVPKPYIPVEVVALIQESRHSIDAALKEISGVLHDSLKTAVAPTDSRRGRVTPKPPPAIAPGRPAAEQTRGASTPAAAGTPHSRVLDSLAWLEAVGFPQPTKQQVGLIAGYRVGKKIAGHFANILGELRSGGLITYPSGGRAALTSDGRAQAQVPDIERTTEGLQREIFARLDEPERRVLSVIVNAYPDAISKFDVGAAAGYEVGTKIAGHYANLLGRLRTLGLVSYPEGGMVRAEPVLFLER